jgi:hypothetical protein
MAALDRQKVMPLFESIHCLQGNPEIELLKGVPPSENHLRSFATSFALVHSFG